jgi:hypothetical protein
MDLQHAGGTILVAYLQRKLVMHFAAQHVPPAARRPHPSGMRQGEMDGQKKARYESGLNLSLEENRGDRCIMLHRKKQIQFRFSMTAIGFINGTTVRRYRGARLVH